MSTCLLGGHYPHGSGWGTQDAFTGRILTSDRKYEKDGGPGLSACAELIRRFSCAPHADMETLATWVFFNIFSGNYDSHAKNLSLLQHPGEGMRLSPLYDLMCTRTYPGLSRDFAFHVGGQVHTGQMGALQLEGMSEQTRLSREHLLQIASDLASRLPRAIDLAFEEIKPCLSHGARTFALYLVQSVKSDTRKALSRFQGSHS